MRSLVVRLFLAGWLGVLLAPVAVHAQVGAYVELHAGIGHASLQDAKLAHLARVSTYRSQGIDVPIQHLFPATYVFGATFQTHIRRYKPLVGLNLEYYTSRAVSRYSDYSGTLDIVTQANAALLEVQVAYPVIKHDPVTINLGVRSGVVMGLSKTEERVAIAYEPWDANYEDETNLNSLTNDFTFSAFSEALYPLTDRIDLLARVVYRHATYDGIRERENGERETIDYDLSGFSLQLGTRLPL